MSWNPFRNLYDKLDWIITSLSYLHERLKSMASSLDDLTAQVAKNTTVEASAVTLIEGIAAQLAAAGTDPAKLAALTTQLNASATALAAAITQNTPVVPPTPPAPTPAP